MSYKDYLKKKKDYSGVLRDSSEREIKVEQTKQAQANRPIGPRQNVRAPEKTMAQKMLDKTAEFLGRTTGFNKLREKERQVNNVVKTANDLGVFRKIGDTFQGGFNKAFGNKQTAWGTKGEKRDKSEVIQPSFKYKGNIDLNSLPTVQNEDGSQSTVLSFSIQDERDGKETLIPQVVNGKIVSEDEAIKHYYETGKHLGKFDSIKEADKYAEKLHEEEEKRISQKKENQKSANPLLLKSTADKEAEEKEKKPNQAFKNVEVRLPNGLVQQEEKDTWGQVLEKTMQNIQESDIKDTLEYAPKIGENALLGSKQKLEQMGQYYYETMPSHIDQGRWGEGISQIERSREIAKEELIKEKGIGVINTEEYQRAGDTLFQQWEREDQAKIDKIIEEAPNYVARKLAEQAPSFGGSLLGGVVGMASPIASIGYFFGSSGQSYYEEALQRGMNDDDAYLYSGIMATWESASDSAITAQNVNFLKSKITGKEISGNTMKLINNQFVENAVQEAVTEPFQELMVGVTGGREYMQTSDLVPRMLDSGFWGGIQGALSGGLTGITASTFNNAQDATSYLREKIQQQIQKKGKEKFAQDFIKGAQDTMSKSAKRMAEMSIDSSQLTEKQRTDIMRIINKPSSNLEQIKNAIQIAQAWNEAVEGAYKSYRGSVPAQTWQQKINSRTRTAKIQARQEQKINKVLNENNIPSESFLEKAIEDTQKSIETNQKKLKTSKSEINRGVISKNIEVQTELLNEYNSIRNQIAEIKGEKNQNNENVVENVETQENQPSTIENKPLLKNNQQTIQEEGKTSENATSQETEAKALSKRKKKSKLLNIKSSENITSQEVEQNIKNYLENNEILSEEDLDEKIKTEKDKKELERLQGLKNTIAEMRNSVTENNTKEETPEQKQRKSEILETIGKTEEEWNKMSQYGKERTLDNFSLDEITDEDRSLMLEENVVNNEKIEKVEETKKQNVNSETIETTDKKKLPRKAKLFFDDYTRKDIKRLIEEKGKNELLEDFDKSQNQQMDRAEFENELDKIINKINKDNKKFKMPEDTQTNKVVEKATQNINDLEEIKKESKKSKNEGDTRVYSHLKLGLESDFVDKEAQKTIAKIIPTPDGRYDVIHNDDKILESEEKISEEGIDEVYNNYIKKFDTGKEMTLDDVYDAEVMIQQYSYKGDSKKVLELLARQAIVVKMAGQKAQAASIMTRGTKEGRLFYIEKGLQRYNAEYGENIKMNQKLVDKLLKSKTNKEIDKAIDEIYKDIGKQMPATAWERADSWRFFSMLFNPSTHLRNTGGNLGMHGLQAFKNTINGVMQDVYKKINPKYEQTVSFARGNLISKALNREYYTEIRDFAKEDLSEIGDIDSYGSKYSETFKSEVDKYKRTLLPGFDQASKLNEKALELEDKLFLNWEYQKSLGRYIAANGWNVENDIKVNKNDSKEVADRKRKNLEKARKWAVKEALEATFHQKSEFATMLSNWEQRIVNNERKAISLGGTVGKVLLDSKLPFKKIPINVLKTAGAYSPFGLLTSTGGILTDAIGEKRNINKEYSKKLKVLEEKLNTNEISQERFDRQKNNLEEDRNTKIIDMYNNRFDKIAKGTAGTILAGIGAILAQSGLARITGADEDDEDEFNSEIAGEKKYSLVIGDEINIPIDSLAPASVPFLIGANFMQEFKKDTGLDTLERAKNAGIISLTSVVDPIVEVSFLQGITSSIKSFAYNEKIPEGFQAFLFGLGLDYINQMVPAIGGKINKVIDPTVRDTSSAQKGAAGQWQRTKNQMISKLNSRLLAPKKDRWGNEISRNDTPLVGASTKVFGDNTFGRGFGRLLDAVSPTNPNYIKQLDKTEKELLEISGKTDKNVLPTQKTIDKKYKVDGKEYVLTDEEFRRSKETFGETSKEMLDALVNSKDYKNLDDPKVKAELMNDIYSYAKQVSKEEYFKKHGLKFEVSSTQAVNDMYNTLTEIKKANGKVSDYFDYLVGVKKNGLSGKAKKLEYLQKMNLPDKIEKIIYENDVGTYQSISKGADEDYNALKSITGNKVSNSYLDYVEKNSQGYFKDQKKEGGKGHQQKLEEFLNSSDLSNIERYYIYTMDGNTGYAKYLSKDQRAALRKAIENNQLNISEEKYNDIIKRLNKADNGG